MARANWIMTQPWRADILAAPAGVGEYVMRLEHTGSMRYADDTEILDAETRFWFRLSYSSYARVFFRFFEGDWYQFVFTRFGFDIYRRKAGTTTLLKSVSYGFGYNTWNRVRLRCYQNALVVDRWDGTDWVQLGYVLDGEVTNPGAILFQEWYSVGTFHDLDLIEIIKAA